MSVTTKTDTIETGEITSLLTAMDVATTSQVAFMVHCQIPTIILRPYALERHLL
jgi:hypothetical protein